MNPMNHYTYYKANYIWFAKGQILNQSYAMLVGNQATACNSSNQFIVHRTSTVENFVKYIGAYLSF